MPLAAEDILKYPGRKHICSKERYSASIPIFPGSMVEAPVSSKVFSRTPVYITVPTPHSTSRLEVDPANTELSVGRPVYILATSQHPTSTDPGTAKIIPQNHEIQSFLGGSSRNLSY